ncbi:MAG: metallophosphoesterase, partial [Pseudomonadota bacterium]
RPCCLYDADRVILPAYGTYTGGLRSHDVALSGLMRQEARAVLTGQRAHVIPMPRGAF